MIIKKIVKSMFTLRSACTAGVFAASVALAPAAFAEDAYVAPTGAQAINKSYPGFFEAINSIGGDVHVLQLRQ